MPFQVSYNLGQTWHPIEEETIKKLYYFDPNVTETIKYNTQLRGGLINMGFHSYRYVEEEQEETDASNAVE